MTVSRRALLKGMLGAAAAGAAATSTIEWSVAAAAPAASLVVYDGRLPQSVAAVGRFRAPGLDVAREPENFWRSLRSTAPRGRVVGFTRWSDFVQVRGCLESSGLRVRVAQRRGSLFWWEMS